MTAKYIRCDAVGCKAEFPECPSPYKSGYGDVDRLHEDAEEAGWVAVPKVSSYQHFCPAHANIGAELKINPPPTGWSKIR
jgi:hypothetical protein